MRELSLMTTTVSPVTVPNASVEILVDCLRFLSPLLNRLQ